MALTPLSSLPCLALTLVAVLHTTAAQAQATSTASDGSLILSRYTTTAAAPLSPQAAPLDVVVQLAFPRQQVQTVGDAIEHTLLRTGYRLAPKSALSPQARQFLTLPLPESQRALGTYSVQTVLNVLVAPAFAWSRDDVNRIVWFAPVTPSSPQGHDGNTGQAHSHAVRNAHIAPVTALPQTGGVHD